MWQSYFQNQSNFFSGAASLMKKAEKAWLLFSPKTIHLTCLSRRLNKVAKTLRMKYLRATDFSEKGGISKWHSRVKI